MTSVMTSEQLSELIGLAQKEVRRSVETQMLSTSMSFDDAQKILSSSTVFEKHFRTAAFAAFREFFLKNNHLNHDYRGPEPVVSQLEQIRMMFPGIGGVNAAYLARINSGEITFDTKGFSQKDQGYWCIPRWEAIASTYSEAVRMVFVLLKESFGGKFSASESSQVDEYCLKESKYKRQMMNRIFSQQRADVLIMEAQFGNRYGGKVAKEVRALMASNEFCLGVYEVAMMLLLSKNRFNEHHDNLGIDASGDLWRYPGSERFVCTPFFSYRALVGVEFGCHRLQHKECYGAASALVHTQTFVRG